jgi:hypothetical protein
MESQMVAGFFKIKGVKVGRCPAMVQMVFKIISAARPYKDLKRVAEISRRISRLTKSEGDETHWWEMLEIPIKNDGYYFLALTFLASVKDVSGIWTTFLTMNYQMSFPGSRSAILGRLWWPGSWDIEHG